MEIIILIFVGSFAYRGACSIGMLQEERRGILELPIAFKSIVAKQIVSIYIIIGLPLSFFAGYLLKQSWIHAFIVFGGTWLSSLIANSLKNLFFRYNPTLQFMVYGLINIVWFLVNLIRTITG